MFVVLIQQKTQGVHLLLLTNDAQKAFDTAKGCEKLGYNGIEEGSVVTISGHSVETPHHRDHVFSEPLCGDRGPICSFLKTNSGLADPVWLTSDKKLKNRMLGIKDPDEKKVA